MNRHRAYRRTLWRAYRWVYCFVRWTLPDIPDCIWAFFQRGWRGYADRDLWDMGSYLSCWLPKALRQLARTTCDHPSDTVSETEWIVLLNKMADGFEAYQRLIDLSYTGKDEQEALQQQARYGMRLFVERLGDLWES